MSQQSNPQRGLSVGLFGGSFNPIHNGHLALARVFLAQARLDEVWFMVSPQNPLKRQADLLDEELRLAMVEAAVRDNPGLRASDFEFSLPRPSYTWHTLRALSAAWPRHRFTLLVGGDNWKRFAEWHRASDILSHYRVAVYPRQGQEVTDTAPGLATDANRRPPLILHAPLIDISSTEVRRRVGNGQPIGHLVPPAVEAIITREHYYNII